MVHVLTSVVVGTLSWLCNFTGVSSSVLVACALGLSFTMFEVGNPVLKAVTFIQSTQGQEVRPITFQCNSLSLSLSPSLSPLSFPLYVEEAAMFVNAWAYQILHTHTRSFATTFILGQALYQRGPVDHELQFSARAGLRQVG